MFAIGQLVGLIQKTITTVFKACSVRGSMLCPTNMLLPVHSPFHEPHCLFINLHYRFSVRSQQTLADSHHSLFLALIHHVFTRDGLSEVPEERREWYLFSMRRSLVITHKTLRESLPSHDRFAETSLSHDTVIPPHPKKKKKKKEKRKFGRQRFLLWGQILRQGKPAINHASAVSWTVQIYTCWIYVAEAIWQKSIRSLVVRAGRRLMRTTYCTQEKVSGREAEWKTELWEWWMDGSERRAEKGSRKRWLVPDWLSDSLLAPLTHHLHTLGSKR